MAFATNQYINGQWTTVNVDLNDVLKHYNDQDDANTLAPDLHKVPVVGLLSQTVVRSPFAQWIFPAKLRDSSLNDVAFIGVSTNYLSCSKEAFGDIDKIHYDLSFADPPDIDIRKTLYTSRSSAQMDSYGTLASSTTLASEFVMPAFSDHSPETDRRQKEQTPWTQIRRNRMVML